MSRSIIITAGGIGARMGNEIPKQFMLLGHKPVLIHTLEIFHEFDQSAQIIITLPSHWVAYWKELLVEFNVNIAHEIVDGGTERFHSVQNAITLCKGEQIAIHDGVRPLVSKNTIGRCFEALDLAPAVVPVLSMKDSLRVGSYVNSKNVDRSSYFLVHTPQCFNASILKKAYQQSFKADFTDDASVVEAFGIKPILIESNEENIKITSALDLKILNAFLLK